MKYIRSQGVIFLFLLGVSLLPLVSMFLPGFPVTHDGQDHVVRIANFYQSLTEGNIIPRWAGNLNWGYGHPILMFLYPFPSYIASFFHTIGFSLVDATKGVFVIAFICSICSMYIWMQAVWGKKVGLLGAILYGFAPYRFVDLYVRGAIGEHMAFIFPPLICFFVFKLATDFKFRISNFKFGLGFSISLALFILSHNAISLMFLPVIGFYVLYLYYFEAKKSFSFLLTIFYFFLLGFGLSAFFWVPAFFEGKYTLRDIVTSGEAMDRFVPWNWFFYSPWNYGGTALLTKSIGYIQWFCITCSLLVLWKLKEYKQKIILFGSLLVFIGSLWIMTSMSGFIWERVTILQNFQFPWRFLSVSTFLAAVIGSVSLVYSISNLSIPRKNVFFVGVCLLSVFLTYSMWHPKEYVIHDDSFYSRVYPGTTDTGESSPIWSVRFMEHTPANLMEVIDGDAVITVGKRTSTKHEYTVVAQKQTRMVENTLFFPGWKIFVDGVSAGIQFQDPAFRGLMTFWMDEGKHQVLVTFTDTKVRYYASVTSLISLGILILTSIPLLFLCKRKK